MTTSPNLVTVNRLWAFAVTDLDEIVPITNYFDEHGETQDRETALSAIAGPDSRGIWFTIELSLYDYQTYH